MLPGILGLHSVAGASAAATASDTSTNDQFLSNVKLLLAFDGADASTSASDESPAAHGAATFAGNAQLDTAQKKFGTASLLLDGTGDYVRYPDSPDWAFGSGPFTIEAFVRFNAKTGFRTILCQGETVVFESWLFDYAGGTDLRMRLTEGAVNSFVQAAWSPTLNTWYHVCAERSGNTVRLYADGVMLTSASYTGTLNDTTKELTIGSLSLNSPGNYFDGWIDEVRITKGVARYASDSGFTVPSAAYPRT